MFTFFIDHTSLYAERPRRRRCLRRPTRREMLGPTRRQVACQCFSDSRPEIAVARLRRWVHSDPEMRRDMQRAGYRPYSRRFTPKQVDVLRRYFGDIGAATGAATDTPR